MNKRQAVAQPLIALDLPASRASLDPLEACTGAVLERVQGLAEQKAADILQTVRQAFVHSLARTSEDGDDEDRHVALTLSPHPHRLIVELDKSWNCSFNLADAPKPRLEEPGGGEPGLGLGMGLFLTRQLMDRVSYQPQAGNNRWRLVKHLPLPEQETAGAAPSYTIRLDLPATHKYLNVLGACIESMLAQIEELPDREQLVYSLQLAVQETATNIVNHAYAGGAGRIKVTMTLCRRARQFIIEMHDTGQHTFDLASAPDPFEAPQLAAGSLLSGSARLFLSIGFSLLDGTNAIHLW